MKAGVVGVGRLGGALAFGLARDGAWDEIVLTDVVESLAWAQAEDIRHGLPDRATVVRAGALQDLQGADLVVVTAGTGRKPGMSRLDLLRANAPIVASVGRGIAEVAPDATIVLLTNPLDVMTALVQRASGFPRERVLGSGALVDSWRFRLLLADRLGLRPGEVEGTVLGEHGDRAVPVWSHVRVRGRPAELDERTRDAVREDLRTLSARVIAGKGWTSFGPGGCTGVLVRALFARRSSVVPASVVLAGEYGVRDVALGVPALVGRGMIQGIEEWALPHEELRALREAGRELAPFVKDALAQAGLEEIEAVPAA